MIFMGSDPIALPLLRWLANDEESGIDIVAVYTQPDRPRGRGKKVVPNEIKTWALEQGIEVRQPEKMRKSDRLDIEADGIDAILVMAFGHMLSSKLIATPSKGIWNLHTSLLPKYRGASPVQCAVASGDEETGVSLMEMVLQMDAGAVLDVERVSIGRIDTALDIDARLAEASVPLLQRNIGAILEGSARPSPQDADAASYVRKLEKGDGVLDFRMPARVVAKRVNGLFPWPGTRFTIGESIIKIGLADWDEREEQVAPGTVIGLGDGAIEVACGEGVLRLLRLQRPGGKMMDAVAFANGFEIPAGTILKSIEMPELVT